MSKISFDESLFVLAMDGESDAVLYQGEILPDGITIDEIKDQGEKFTLYGSKDGAFDILAVEPDLAERWLTESLLPKRALLPHLNAEGKLDCYFLISPSSLRLARLTDVRVWNSSYYAHLVASCIFYTRYNDPEVNLRDGILCELYGVILPTYTLTPRIADIALFNNTLRGKYDPEDLRSAQDIKSGASGLNRMSFNLALSEHNMPTDRIEPCLDIGEEIDDMVVLPATYQHVSVTGSLELNEYYQIFSTDTDLVVLLMSNSWAQELFERKLVMQMSFKPMLLAGERWWIKTFSRRSALENLNNRHYGVKVEDFLKLALAIYNTLDIVPEASWTNALYCQELNICLPVKFSGGSVDEAIKLMIEISEIGPFAQGAFTESVLKSALAILRQKV